MFEVQIYGIPLTHPGDYEWKDAAVERAKRELKDKQYPVKARVIDKKTRDEVWSGYLTADVEIIETK